MTQALGFIVSADTSTLLASMVQAGQVTDREAKRMQRALEYVSAQLKQVQGAQQAANQTTNASVAAQNAAAQEMRKHRAEANNLTQAYRQLPMQITDVVTSLASGMPVWMIAIQQGGQIKDSFGGIVPAARALASMLTVARVAMGGAAAAAALFAYEVYKGYSAAEDLRKSLALTSNAAGLTSDSFRAIAAGTAKSAGATVGAGRDMAQALAATGRIARENMESATRAGLLYAAATGDNADAVAKDMAAMADGVHKWATEHNRSMHFMSAADLEHIKSLEDHGRAQEAAGEVLRAYNDHLDGTRKQLGYIEQAYKSVKSAWSEWMAGIQDFGAPNTVGDVIKRESDRLVIMRREMHQYELAGGKGPAVVTGFPQWYYGSGDALFADLRKQEALIDRLKESQAMSARVAAASSDSARRQQEGAAAADVVRQLTIEVDQRSKAAKEIERYTTAVRKMREAGMPTAPTEKQEAATIAEIRKKYGPKPEHAYSDLLIDIEKYNALSDEMAGTTKKIADYDQWAADMRARLAKETDKMTAAERRSIESKIVAAAASRHHAEEIKKNAEMEQDMLDLLNKKGLIGDRPAWGEEVQRAATSYMESITDTTKSAQAFVSGAFQRMEDSVLSFLKTGKLSFSSLFSFMAEEYIRNVIRMAEQKLFTDAAGNFSIGSVFKNVAGMLGFGSHANGLDYVPRDGYIAMLHKGERVQTAMEASATRQGAGGSGQVIDASVSIGSVGSGVSRGEMMAAVQQARSAAVEDVRRRLAAGTMR